MTSKKVAGVKVVMAVICVITLAVGLYFAPRLIKRQTVSLSYTIALSPPKGQTLDDVRVLLPFPVHDGKPVMQLLPSLKKNYEKYFKDKCPDVSLVVKKTRYGYMLEIKAPRVSANGIAISGAYSFKQANQTKSIAPQFDLQPAHKRERIPGSRYGTRYTSKYFASNRKGIDTVIGFDYDIFARTPWLLPLDYIPENNYYTFFGYEKPLTNLDRYAHPCSSSGWNDIVISELGYF